MTIPPIANCFYRTVMRALAAGNEIMEAYFGLFFMPLNGLHRAGAHTLFAADALMLIHLHSINKGQLTAKIMH